MARSLRSLLGAPPMARSLATSEIGSYTEPGVAEYLIQLRLRSKLYSGNKVDPESLTVETCTKEFVTDTESSTVKICTKEFKVDLGNSLDIPSQQQLPVIGVAGWN